MKKEQLLPEYYRGNEFIMVQKAQDGWGPGSVVCVDADENGQYEYVPAIRRIPKMSGARLLTDYPGYYQGLVIIAGATYPIGSGSSWYTKLATFPRLDHLFRYAIVPVLAPIISPESIQESFHPQAAIEDYSDQTCLDLLFSPERFLANAEDLNQVRPFLDESYPLYTKIEAPVSLIYGDQDQIIAKFTHAGGFKYQVPHARNIMLPNVGHLPHYFHQDIIRQEIERISASATSELGFDLPQDDPLFR